MNKEQEKEFEKFWKRKDKERFATYLSRILKEFGKNPTGENRNIIINQVRKITLIKERSVISKIRQQDRDKYISELERLSNELYDEMPTGKIDAFELLKIIEKHILKISKLIKALKDE